MLIENLAAAATSTFQITDKIATTIEKCCLIAAPIMENNRKNHHRRSDDDFKEDHSGIEKKSTCFQYEQSIPLLSAIHFADNMPGVYVLRLNGQVMKCGRASYDKGAVCGIVWRLRQYYNLNYDDRARAGDYWSVNAENRDRITVSWQCCPVSKCHELEYKLFKKYGKGLWAKRAPIACSDDSWELLI